MINFNVLKALPIDTDYNPHFAIRCFANSSDFLLSSLNLINRNAQVVEKALNQKILLGCNTIPNIKDLHRDMDELLDKYFAISNFVFINFGKNIK